MEEVFGENLGKDSDNLGIRLVHPHSEMPSASVMVNEFRMCA